ncbi:hypothetical protein EVAR_84345_1 [Eumeta japonica]|uniref:Uncharacterized protein n=1 Tax=Eumeta variegata TaxID=151549 RepID=A0A4C1U4I6_EUMVA|nr:hypothetical protein EVAR_84345_1 [Eumeta japonica]
MQLAQGFRGIDGLRVAYMATHSLRRMNALSALCMYSAAETFRMFYEKFQLPEMVHYLCENLTINEGIVIPPESEKARMGHLLFYCRTPSDCGSVVKSARTRSIPDPNLTTTKLINKLGQIKPIAPYLRKHFKSSIADVFNALSVHDSRREVRPTDHVPALGLSNKLQERPSPNTAYETGYTSDRGTYRLRRYSKS